MYGGRNEREPASGFNSSFSPPLLSLSRAPYLQVETSAEGVQQLKRETEEGGKIGRRKKEEKRRRRKKKKGTCSRGTERAESVASSLLPSLITTSC